MDTLLRDPIQPVFVCKSFRRQSTVYEVYQILCSTNNINENSQQVIESSTNFQKSNSRDSRDELINQFIKQVERLTTELNQAREQISKLMALQASTQVNNSSQAITNTEFSPLYGANSQNLDGSISQGSWHNPSKVTALKQSMYLNRQKSRIRKEETAARFFQPPSTNQEFQYLYVSTKAHVPVGKLRSYLRNMGVNNARVLDIHYPDCNITALLIHNDYVTEFKQLLKSKRLHLANNFDPRTVLLSNIRNIKILQNKNKLPKHWLPKTFIDQLNNSRYGQSEDVFDMDEYTMDNFSKDTTTNVTNLNNIQR
ncbi:hypothetical protein CU097_012524 [Rhizopus azygosporus]|uniref:Uncharacterized protein n=1 Tax=Rhizopus azygosporus TaxID=86630 RepID=A0A367K1Y2_RHIAZ|nr:hypothetical protein CU097_012524 [Rhizopus azygosporus]